MRCASRREETVCVAMHSWREMRRFSRCPPTKATAWRRNGSAAHSTTRQSERAHLTGADRRVGSERDERADDELQRWQQKLVMTLSRRRNEAVEVCSASRKGQ